MFGSNSAFGQSSPVGSQSVFGQNNNPSSNPFAPNPFGSTSPFGSQTGGSIFGNTSTGVFGATPSSSPFSSTPAFGASSSPAFGASSTPAFGSSSASAGGSSLFGQNPASPFGGFGSNTQSSPFGSTFQQSQPAFGNSLFGSSSPFGASSQPSFGATSTPAFGSSSTPTFGSTSSPGFGASSTPAFGSTATSAFGNTGTAFGLSHTPVFGASSSPAFGASSAPAFGASSTPAFGASSTPAFGTSNTTAFGASSTPAFGTSSTPAFGAASTPAFGTSSTPAFGASSSPSFNFGSTSAFGQSSSAFGGSSPFGSTASPFGAQSSPFGAQATTPTFGGSTFGQTAFGGQQGGSRVVQYAPTTDPDSASGTQPGKLESISAMPAYKDRSHEELRWEDFQRGDKGGPSAASQPSAGVSFGVSAAQSSPFASSSTFGQSSSNPFSVPASSNPFSTKPSAFGSQGFGTPSPTAAFGSSPFGGSSTSNPFGSTSAAGSSIFGQSTAPAFASTSSTSIFGQSSSSPFGSSASLFGSTSVPGSTPSFASGLSFANTQTPSLFPSTTPSLGQTGSAFGQTGSAFGQTASSFGQTSSPFGSSTLFNSSSAFGSNLFSSSPSPLTTSNTLGFSQSTPSLFQASQPVQSSSAFNFSNFGQTQPAGASGFGSGSSMFGQSFGQTSASQNPVVVQPLAVANPFGTLPAMPQMSIGRAGTSPSIQYGISSMPVVDKPAPVRISSLLTSRHLSQRRIKMPARKYHPKSDSLKVPFFSDDEEAPNTPKADALLIPRENPRALVIRPRDQGPAKGNLDNSSPLKDGNASVHENGKIYEKEDYHFSNGRMSANNESPGENGSVKEPTYFEKATQKANGVHDNCETQKGDSYITFTGHRAGEAAIVYEHGADIEAMMPKLWHSDYYTQPRIQEMAAKERADPGYCRHVKDFVIGRHGYGSIKFLGETDVRRLDLESLIQFNNREVIVYMDDSKKPPVGQGLNKPAEVTLLNIECYDKKTGQQYTEGPKIERYKEMLKKKAEDQGAEFLSYDPVKGEWIFKVHHFSRYNFSNDEDDWENVDIGAGALC